MKAFMSGNCRCFQCHPGALEHSAIAEAKRILAETEPAPEFTVSRYSKVTAMRETDSGAILAEALESFINS